jgi:hypothetical protein
MSARESRRWAEMMGMGRDGGYYQRHVSSRLVSPNSTKMLNHEVLCVMCLQRDACHVQLRANFKYDYK